ncbi:hypothetical protein SAMN05216188_104157 [Lentzea xinjiangensis]|uniref:Uncharacterized protein n=1 Tax=Lentzea xinjiangensis TaxID=402600 RepID=A0A1H9HQW4_9PSEU|nr:hypothetical protein [Lentzea xinjiangensis]SEQ64724.1 hypothetical protein SAMN05216188_104157 [Lentzea xinjiangensis]
MKRKPKAVEPVSTTVTQEQVKLLALVEQGGVHRGATRWYVEHRPAQRWDADDLEVLRQRCWITWEHPERPMRHGMAAPVWITAQGRAALRHHLPEWVSERRAVVAAPPRLPRRQTIRALDAL